MGIKPGDKLWYVPNYRRGQGYEVVVGKVGRKLADIGERRAKLDMQTMVAKDSSYTYGKCYASEADYLAECKLGLLKDSFMQEVRHSYGRPWTLEQITKAAEILGIELLQ